VDRPFDGNLWSRNGNKPNSLFIASGKEESIVMTALGECSLLSKSPFEKKGIRDGLRGIFLANGEYDFTSVDCKISNVNIIAKSMHESIVQRSATT
jgi:hypothetical protein